MLINGIIIFGVLIGIPLIIMGFKKLFQKEPRIWRIGKGIEIPESVGFILVGGIFLYLPLISAYVITARLNINPIVIHDRYTVINDKIQKLNSTIEQVEKKFDSFKNEIQFSFTPYLDTTFVKLKLNDKVFHSAFKNYKIVVNSIAATDRKVNLIFITPEYRDPNIWLHTRGNNYTYSENNFRFIISLEKISLDANYASISFSIEKKLLTKEVGHEKP